jgi:hypothetical protein
MPNERGAEGTGMTKLDSNIWKLKEMTGIS